MKRLAFCFDGTWQKLTQPYPTNVALTAESIVPFASGNFAQSIFYDEGVGTDPREKWSGGIFGVGIMKVLADAYRFLVFNYEAGDELFVFGFSRGAFAARSFVGLVSHCGVLDQRFAGQSVDLIDLYEKRDDSKAYADKMMEYRGQYCSRACVLPTEDQWRVSHCPGYEAGSAPLLTVAYLGVWDTVGAMGVPSWAPFSHLADKKYKFHDLSLSALVKSARHAVAIDERRLDYNATLWNNIDDLNRGAGFDPIDGRAPYQQKWFPGVHGSVGGGGDRHGLSDQTLEWIWDGAGATGLVLDTTKGSRIYQLNPTPLEWLDNSSASRGWSWGAILDRLEFRADRSGPVDISNVSTIARRRWQAPADLIPECQSYRPGTLRKVADALDKLPTVSFPDRDGREDAGFAIHVVAAGETLSSIALQYYRDAALYSRIFDANAWKLEDADHIYIGQSLRIPIEEHSSTNATVSRSSI